MTKKSEGKEEHSSENQKKNNAGALDTLKEIRIQKMSEKEFMAFLRKKDEEVLVDVTLNELVDKVMTEDEKMLPDKMVTDHLMEEMKGVEMEETGKDFTDVEHEQVNGTINGLSTPGVNLEDELKACPNDAGVVAAAAIPEVLNSPARASPRLAQSTEEHTLSRAERRTTIKNLESMEGKSSCNSFCSFDLNDAVSNVRQLGVVFGFCESEMVSSVKEIFDLEAARVSTASNFDKCEVLSQETDSEVESIENIESRAIKQLCGELLEEVFDDDSYHLSYDSEAVLKRSKSVSAKSRKRKTCKVNICKNPKIVVQ